MVARIFSDATARVIADQYRAGMTTDELCREYLCSNHAVRNALQRQGVEFRERGPVPQSKPPRQDRRSRGENHWAWKGGRHVTSQGYVRVLLTPDDPYFAMVSYNRTVPEHRYVMAQHLGRALTSKEQVHHINGDRGDNRIENLQLRSGAHGKGVRLECRACGSQDILALPLPEEVMEDKIELARS